MSVIAVLNPLAGSVPSDARNRLRRKLVELGHTVADIVDFDPEWSRQQLETLGARSHDLFIIWGGDGTHRTALNVLGRHREKLLLLPGGTKNLLSRSLHGPKKWDAIVEAATLSPTLRSLPAGRLQDELFFCALLVGSPALFAEVREDLRIGDLAEAMNDFSAGMAAAADLCLSGFSADGQRADEIALPRSNVIGALVGPLSTSGGMEVAAVPYSREATRLSMLWATIQSSWRDVPGVELRKATSLVVTADGRNLPAIADGEPIKAGERLEVTFVENAATCMATA
jgi:diacylglycerol kinase family enzyme